MKFDHTHYIPILKGKMGELEAIRNTSPKIIKKFTPLIEVPPIPPKYLDGQEDPVPGKTIDQHVIDVCKGFAKSLGGLPYLFVDAYYIEVEDELKNGMAPVDAIFKSLRAGGINFVPTIGLDRVEDYADSVKAAIKTDKRGCCLRLWESDLEGMAETSDQIDSLLQVLGVAPKDVDLLVDFGPKVQSKVSLPLILNMLPRLEEWRTFSMAASSFPANMIGVGKNKIEELDREEWISWLSLRSKQKTVKRMPTFADYAINHPVISDLDFRLMNMSPNIRYTAALSYVVAKGQAQPRKNKAVTAAKKAERESLSPSEQYPKLAQMIKGHQSWKGAAFSWGDGFIEKCSRRECVGSATNWRAVGTSHHIALTVQQIANLP